MNKNDTVNICGWDIDRDELMENIFEATADAVTHPGFTAGVYLDTEDGSLKLNSCGNGITERMFHGVDICIWVSDNYEFWSPFLDWFDEDSREQDLRDMLDDQTVDAYLEGCEDDDERRDALVRCYCDNRLIVDTYILENTDFFYDMIVENLDLDSIADKVNFSYEEENDED